ncbi:MAG TPA: late competence development ComFB family protein [Gemmatimonadaceae bacterium]|nr:late competence development ComFB family protein [Gemmatimonadaceae bacterium]
MKNALEEVIDSLHDGLLTKSGARFCACEQCRDDAIAHALNKARPRYVGSATLGAAVTRVNLDSDQARAELSVLVLDAMRRVNENPRHGPDGFVPSGGGAT